MTKKAPRKRAGKERQAEPPKKIGRPSTFNTTVAQRIFDGLIDGRSLRSICKDEGMPVASTVFLWLSKDQSFSEQYARAKEAGIEAMAEDIIDIADSAIPFMGKVDKEKLQVDARKWYMSKIKPKKYGDSTTLKGDADNPLGGVIVVPLKDVPAAVAGLAPQPKAG